MNALAGLFVILGVPGLIAVLSIWRGYVLSIMWAWFLVPLGMTPISVSLAIGFALIVGFLTVNNQKKEHDGVVDSLASSIATPLVFLIIGWIVHFFV